jgi:hypothetical protein
MVAHGSQCELFGTFGFFVQFTLGVLSFMSLVSKFLFISYFSKIIKVFSNL